MGRFIVATGVNPDSTHPLVNVFDPVMPVTAGALILLDPKHPTQSWSSGVPGSGVSLPNIALAQCRAAFPSLTDAQCQPILTIGSTFAAHGLAERSSKGGLHLARSAVAGDANTLATLQMPDTFIRSSNGLAGVTGHSFFISLWGRITKSYDSTYTGAPQHAMFTTGGQASNTGVYGFYSRRATGETNYPTDSRRIGYRASGITNLGSSIGPFIQNIGISSISGTISGTDIAHFLEVGNSPFNSSSNNGKTGSFLFYRFYMEDLTVSGRSYATVDALDFAQYTADVLTSGGRYYGDAFTDPATLVA